MHKLGIESLRAVADSLADSAAEADRLAVHPGWPALVGLVVHRAARRVWLELAGRVEPVVLQAVRADPAASADLRAVRADLAASADLLAVRVDSPVSPDPRTRHRVIPSSSWPV
ncbi:MAG: hypothetical protein RIS70_553 [Planctomycetota bacterium]